MSQILTVPRANLIVLEQARRVADTSLEINKFEGRVAQINRQVVIGTPTAIRAACLRLVAENRSLLFENAFGDLLVQWLPITNPASVAALPQSRARKWGTWRNERAGLSDLRYIRL